MSHNLIFPLFAIFLTQAFLVFLMHVTRAGSERLLVTLLVPDVRTIVSKQCCQAQL
jgi:hypothetical protein